MGVVGLALIVDTNGTVIKSNGCDAGGGTQDDVEMMQTSMAPSGPILGRVGVLLQNIFGSDLIASYLDDVR
jgi:hypothetical protein